MVEILKTSLNYVRRGSGEPLLLLHSLGGELVIWSPVMDLLAAEREVVAVDLPGFGASAPLPDDISPSPANLAQAVISFWDTLGIGEDPHIAGVSMGGWVAVECARRNRARSVTGICAAGFWTRPLRPRRNLAHGAARALLPLFPLLRSRGVRRIAMRRSILHPERIPAAEALRLARSFAGSPAYSRANAEMRSTFITDLDRISVPLTLAWAEHDELVAPTNARPIPDRVEQVELRGCGHLPMWDDPEQVAGVILSGSRSRAEPNRAGLMALEQPWTAP
jgi:pimeloyl-ACP methyl ester carboxylesterase